MDTGASLRTENHSLWPVRRSALASVKLTIALMVSIALCVLLGAWCPQEAQDGKDKVIEMFGPTLADGLMRFGIADIFHSPVFLGLIALLTVNMVACSMQRVFPKARSLRQPMPFLGPDAIAKLAFSNSRAYDAPADMLLDSVQGRLRKAGYIVEVKSDKLTAHWGKWGRLAPTITHIGLLTLLAAVTITSWTGFTGIQGVLQGKTMDFDQSEHSRLWLGKLPTWRLKVDATRRENYAGGDPKQWYSKLSVLDKDGKVVKTQEISVNNPLNYEGVDVYQAKWDLADIAISLGGKRVELPLQQMGPNIHAAFLPLDKDTIIMFSVHSMDEPVRVFAKIPQWPQPRLLAVLAKGRPVTLGSVQVKYDEVIPITGLQYKSDPGLPLTYTAFAFIMLGVTLAAVPHRQVWASVAASPAGGCTFTIGGVSRKAKHQFAKNMNDMIAILDKDFPLVERKEPVCRV